MPDLSDEHFQQYCRIVYQESGINLSEGKRDLLKARLSRRLRKLNIDAAAYLLLIRNDPLELAHFLNAISTNYTFFFRESKCFKYLDGGPQKIWCAASSTGEEPYSLAIYCLRKGFRPSIHATDISTECLRKGRLGIYPYESIENIPKEVLKSCFQKGTGRFQDAIRVKKEIRELVTFEHFNLVKDSAPVGFDVIFCRNVMFYFDRPTKELVVHKLINALQPKGYFIIGGAETLSGLDHDLHYVEPSVYQKNV